MREKSVKNKNLRKLLTEVLKIYRKSNFTRHHENLKHVLRLTRAIKKSHSDLHKINCDPEILTTAILISDLGKEPFIQNQYLHEYENQKFKAFLDHARISMRVGNELRKKYNIDDKIWRKILTSIMGHDGPSIPGSWWKQNYEKSVGRRYPNVYGIEGLIHCYLDRIDQGGIFPGMGSKLTGGLRKISYDLYSGGTLAGNLSKVVYEVFSSTRFGTLEQLQYLDEVVAPRILKNKKIPAFLNELRNAFKDSEKYMGNVIIEDESVYILLDSGLKKKVNTLNEFWDDLSKVTPKVNVSEMCELRKIS